MLHHYKKQWLGTHWHISYEIQWKHLDSEITTFLEKFESRYSRFSPSSLISKLNKEKSIIANDEFLRVLKVWYQAYQKTWWVFSPFVWWVLDDLWYNKDYSFVSKKNISPIESEFSISWNTVRLWKKTTFDVGWYGKWYLIDILASYLIKNNITNRIINGWWDIRFQRRDEQYKKSIILSHPHDPTVAVAERKTDQGAVATSSAELRKWWDHHHLIDPRTKNSAHNSIRSISTFSSSACLADIASTTLYVWWDKVIHDIASLLWVWYVAMYQWNRVKYSEKTEWLRVFTK